MYLIIWEYQVKPQHLAAFTSIYASDGAWAMLFQQSNGFLGTELLRDEGNVDQLITLDRWTSSEAHEEFMTNFQIEYKKLDAECESMTEMERLIGKYILPA